MKTDDMTKSQAKLDAALVWDEAGHLADMAVTALADGELTLLPAQAIEHHGGCGLCSERVGRAALLAVEMADMLARPAVERVTARRPLPVAAFVATLAVAIVGLLPALGGLAAKLTRLPVLVAHASPVLARGIGLVIGAASGSWVFMAAIWMSAALLVLAGVMIARLVPQSMSPKGSV